MPKPSLNIIFFILSIIFTLVLVGLAVIYVRAYFRDDIIIDVTGRSGLEFRVFYVENSLFDTNPIPSDLHFFMSYTDFIEFDSNFNAQFGIDADIFYEYTAVERLVVRYMSTVDANINPVMYHSTVTLYETSGRAFSDRINLNSGYTVFPRPHIKRYLEVMADQARQMAEEGIFAVGMRGLSAELLIDFTYTVWVPSLDFRQTLTQGYRFSLSTEVYGITVTGSSSFTETIVFTNELPFELTLPAIMIFVMAVALSGYGIFNGIKHLSADPNEKRQEVKTLLRKYGNEIVVSPDRINLDEYNLVRIDDFDELLKLAITLTKHIRCYKNDEMTMFTVAVNTDVYIFQIHFNFAENGE